MRVSIMGMRVSGRQENFLKAHAPVHARQEDFGRRTRLSIMDMSLSIVGRRIS
jgi:hypothetical protein